MSRPGRIVLLAVLTMGLSPGALPVAAQIVEDREDAGKPPLRQDFILPFFITTETLDAGFGASYNRGLFASESNLFLAGYVTLNKSWGFIGQLHQLRLGKSRWFVDPFAAVARNTSQRFYGDLASPVGEIEGGTNESGPDDFFEGEGWNNLVELPFTWVLPLGHGRDQVVHRYQTEGGILVDGASGGRWNPASSGRTTVKVKPFYQHRTLGITEDNILQFPPPFVLQPGDTVEHASNGVGLFLEYDNRDFSLNPQGGSLQRVGVTRDFGWLDSFDSWTAVEGEYRKYVSLGQPLGARQAVLALDAWTAYVPTLERIQVGDSVVVENAPPSNMGASLGGTKRLRSYPLGRYSDAAAVYYSAELRFIPSWDPFRSWGPTRKMAWRWWQWAIFGEVGRVAPAWRFDLLHEDMKWSAGISMRAFVGARVFRFELVTGEEATQFWFLIDQPF